MTTPVAINCVGGLREDAVADLSAGTAVEFSGRLLTLRDASAARLARAIDEGAPLPVSLKGQVL